MLGWIRVYDYKDATAPLTAAGRVYSARQLSIARMIANWMQASYLPTGALGDVKVIRNDDLGLYNKDSAGEPHTYGVEAPLYTQLKYDANKKIVPQTTDALLLAHQGERDIRDSRGRGQHAGALLLHHADLRAAGVRTGTRESR